MCCLASSSERDRGVVVIPNAGQTSSTGTLSAYHLTSAAGFRLQHVFQLRTLSGDEQFSGGRITMPDRWSCRMAPIELLDLRHLWSS